jgi:hypothetical protein
MTTRCLTELDSFRAAVELLIERCAGLEVHKASVTATVRVPGPVGRSAAADTVVSGDHGRAGAAG